LSATNYTIDNIIFSIILNGVNFFIFYFLFVVIVV
jgi:hypothetical protein